MSIFESVFRRIPDKPRNAFDEKKATEMISSGGSYPDMHYIDATSRRFKQLYGSGKYKEKGKMEVKHGNLVIRVQYERVMDHTGLSLARSMADKDDKLLTVTGLSIENKKTKDVLDVASLMPGGQKIYLLTQDEHGQCNFEVDDYGNKSILINGDISRPDFVFILLHEIGHALDFDKLGSYERGKFTDGHKAISMFKNGYARRNVKEDDKLTQLNAEGKYLEILEKLSRDDLDKVIDLERNAWLFALKKIWPFLEIDGKIMTEEKVMEMAKISFQTYEHQVNLARVEILPERMAQKKEEYLYTHRHLRDTENGIVNDDWGPEPSSRKKDDVDDGWGN